MKWHGVNELREMFLKFFEDKGHVRMASASLVPQDDKSLLLINSGMAPLKKFFLGQAVPPSKRVTTCQKCIRTPDIERVGKTSRHGTYFEMLGNFSFGDYFKIEAIKWAWEFFTEVLDMPKDKIYISVYEEDDEAYDMWTKQIGVSPDNMVRLGKEDNFWEHGSGPCGPCSELHFDRGESVGCGSPDCQVGCDCDRFVEVWNLVFTQFDSDGKGNYTPMTKPNIDTGMGLERLACIMQGVDNLFEVDTVQNIMKHISKIAGVSYKTDEKTDVSLRVITDHIRSTTFMVGDGVIPSNEGRGYVLRRLLRRAARHGKMLGVVKPFLYEVCETVIDENKIAYPELEEKREYIKKIIKIEEENFARTIDKGAELLNKIMDKIISGGLEKVLLGDDAFKLSDTYGFPIDLTTEIALEKGIRVDEERFKDLVYEQKQKARADRASKVGTSWEANKAVDIDTAQTIFTGYSSMEEQSEVVAILSEGKLVDRLNEGEEGIIVLNKSPFYAESGGQAGDTGEIEGDGLFVVDDTKPAEGGHILHIGLLETGSISVNDAVLAKVNKEKREATMRNHTVAHLLQSALRTVLGEHVRQAGQFVCPERCRFDFSHFSAMTEEEIKKVEEIINEKILEAVKISIQEMNTDEAQKLGAMALFGEKYGDVVRVVNVEDFSMELCGGTHVNNTSMIGLFKIVSESSVAAGVRRIEAVTGSGVMNILYELKDTIVKSASNLKLANINELAERCATVMADIKEKDRQIEKLNQKMASNQLEGIFKNAKEVQGIKIVSALFSSTNAEMLRQIGDKIKDKEKDIIAVLAGISEGKGTLYCICSKSAIGKGAHAGKIVQRVSAITGGKGGGRPDSAMAGVGKEDMIDEALSALEGIVREFLM